MGRDTVSLEPHSPLWAEAYSKVDRALREKFQLVFHHFGSTAIPGIRAKPILDIMAVSPNLSEFDSLRPRVESLGFAWKGEYGIPGRRYCVLYGEGARTSYVHLHAFEKNHADVEANLLFRDYLRSHPGAAAEYGALKESLRLKFSGGRERYTEGKAQFIQEILRKAKAAAPAQNGSPAPRP